MKNYIRKAQRLVDNLQEKCTAETICENYGQKEISKFIDKIKTEQDYQDLSYAEQCDVKDVLYKVSSITNN